MKRLTAHGKLLGLLWLVLTFSTSLTVIAGCGGLLPAPQTQSIPLLQTYEQAVDAFDRIVPGMTNAQDLPHLGFDSRAGNVDMLSYPDIKARFTQAGMRWQQLDPAVRACIHAEIYCSGYVFHPDRASSGSGLVPDILGFARIGPSAHTSASITLLVMNGRVVHKVIS